MAARRLYIVWTHSLFYESVRLILAHPEIEWAGATADHVVVPGQIASLQPDTILVEAEDGDGLLAGILDTLKSGSFDARIIWLSLSRNDLSVFRCEHRTVGRAEDLLHLILAH